MTPGTMSWHIGSVIALFPNSSFELTVGFYMWAPLKVYSKGPKGCHDVFLVITGDLVLNMCCYMMTP